MGQQQRVDALDAPAEPLHADLRAFAAVDEQRTAVDADVQAGQGTVGHGHGAAGAKGTQIKHVREPPWG